MNPPTFISYNETVWNDSVTPKTTPSFNVLAGDVLIGVTTTNFDDAASIGISGGSLTWGSPLQYVESGTFQPEMGAWSAVVDVDKSMTVSFDFGSSKNHGGAVFVWRGSGGVGNSVQNNANDSGVPTVSITPSQENSAIVIISADRNLITGTGRTWLTNAGAHTETGFEDGTTYFAYLGYHADAGAVSAYTVGLSAVTGQRWSIIAVEVKGLPPVEITLRKQVLRPGIFRPGIAR